MNVSGGEVHEAFPPFVWEETMRRFLIALVVAVCSIGLISLWGCDANTEQTASNGTSNAEESQTAQLVRKPLNDYTWSELSQISKLISSAPDLEAQRKVAQVYGIVEEDGTLTKQTKQIVLDDSRALDVRVAGIAHDDKSDGSGKAGITFMTVGAIDILPMNDEATVEGGWESSSLRLKLANEQKGRLDKELSDVLVPVDKLTNNVGLTDSTESITPTSDELWVFSTHEVCGDVSWDSDEYQGKRGYEDLDGMLNAEGEQYEFFVQSGVTGESDPNHVLTLAESTGASPWWYRTPHAFEFQGYGDTGSTGYFYRVADSGFPKSEGSPEEPASVVVGFCV